MIIIGLTGSIGMGKSVLAAQCRFLKIPVHDADAAVHAMMQPDGPAFDDVCAAFPTAMNSGKIDRAALGKIIFHDSDKRHILESIIHPLVRESSNHFVSQCYKRREKLCVLDIPLLFETGRDKDMDTVICTTAPSWVQQRRVLSRPNMSEEKFKQIKSAQIPDLYKRLRSDYIILSCRGHRHTLNALRAIKNAA
jgi:dephospho-CoA kinase